MPEQSILKTIRRMIGPDEDYEHFDTDLIVHINSALARLCELGVGPKNPFYITGTEETWSDFIGTGVDERVKQYIVLSVKNIFDPPSSSSVMNAYKEQIDKLEWLLKETAVTGY